MLIKPPFYTQKITNELLDDIAESAQALNTREKVKRYIESRYLNRLKPEVEISIFRTLWKLVFKVDDEDCKKNIIINFQTLEVISKRNFGKILEKIAGEKGYYSNISSRSLNLDFLVFYLSKNPDVYNLFNEDAKLKISDTEEWQHLFCCLLSSYYCVSSNFNQADSRFQQAISPYLGLFDKEAIVFLIQQIEKNNQVYRRGGAIEEHKDIKKKLFQLHGKEFDLSPYPHFRSNVED